MLGDIALMPQRYHCENREGYGVSLPDYARTEWLRTFCLVIFEREGCKISIFSFNFVDFSKKKKIFIQS